LVRGAQRIETIGPQIRKYVRVGTRRAILEHVEIVDGTGAPAIADRNITIVNGMITAITAGADETGGDGTTILDLKGYSVMPGIVGMHDHLFAYARPNFGADGSFDPPALFHQMTFSAPRLYLANGFTARTAGSVPGFSDQREIELLVDAGFTPLQAIRIATLNGATFLGRQDQIGSIAVGKNADLVVTKGDLATRITDIENVEVVFKDGVGYDTKKLLDSAKGHYGEY
jgi:imidazolonepropionase-like amidohydrolase